LKAQDDKQEINDIYKKQQHKKTTTKTKKTHTIVFFMTLYIVIKLSKKNCAFLGSHKTVLFCDYDF
jgi:hypothetical protein